VRYSQGTMPTTYNFTGQRLDSQTGLLYYGFRYYDPVSGRFVRADTTQTNAGGMDPYAYVGNNPEGRTDPTGMCGLPCLIAFFIIWGSDLLLTTLTAGVAVAPPAHHVNYPSNGPQPVPAPTPGPTATPTPTPTPSTNTNGAGCRTGGCYNLVRDEGTSVYTYTPQGLRLSTAHTIANHVTISDTDLWKRANKLGLASKFYSLDAAEWAVQYALDNNNAASAQLAKLRGNPYAAGQTVTFQADTHTQIGYSYRRGNPNAIADTKITVVMMIDFNGNPFVLTAYPTP